VGDPQRALEVVRTLAEDHPEYPLLQALWAALASVNHKCTEAAGLIVQLFGKGYAIEAYLRERALVLKQLGRDRLAGLLQEATHTLNARKQDV
jgi:antitoxin component HigA of HigAB toxin-antitoxin module